MGSAVQRVALIMDNDLVVVPSGAHRQECPYITYGLPCTCGAAQRYLDWGYSPPRTSVPQKKAKIVKLSKKDRPTLTDEDIPILFAALCSMVEDVHAPQDQLTEEQWERAVELFKAFTAAEEKRQGMR